MNSCRYKELDREKRKQYNEYLKHKNSKVNIPNVRDYFLFFLNLIAIGFIICYLQLDLVLIFLTDFAAYLCDNICEKETLVVNVIERLFINCCQTTFSLV